MAQVRQVVSEALQSTVRDLLPSQQGFTEDLQASNVIIPVIDLTPTAEGSRLDANLQTALSFADITAFEISNTTTTIINNTGYWRVFGSTTILHATNNVRFTAFDITDGLSTKRIARFGPLNAAPDDVGYDIMYDFVVYLTAGDALSGTSNNGTALLSGCVRQIADINGNLISPS